jgi:hypothetical protein
MISTRVRLLLAIATLGFAYWIFWMTIHAPPEIHNRTVPQTNGNSNEIRHKTFTRIESPDEIKKEKDLIDAINEHKIVRASALILAGISPTVRDPYHNLDGGTALQEAASQGYTDLVKLMLDHGAAPNQPGSFGDPPLTWSYRFPEIVRALLKHGARVNDQDHMGHTALYSAIRERCRTSRRILERAGGTW